MVSSAYRPGSALDYAGCATISAVPSHLRTATHMYPHGLGSFYQKYTHAYGIPVLGSNALSNSALQRACYVVRFLMADRAILRQNYYRYFGRFALMGQYEVTTHIPEHTSLGPWWNERARGLGATRDRPVATAGEENALCLDSDRYRVEDIVLHEFAHAVHLLGASYGIRNFDSRLRSLYNAARAAGLWYNTYAMSTDHEYFAEGVQSYFNDNGHANPPDGIHNHVSTRPVLRSYDPGLYALVAELFPCGNTFIKRCKKDREAELDQVLSMNWDGSRCTGHGGGSGGEGDGGGGGEGSDGGDGDGSSAGGSTGEGDNGGDGDCSDAQWACAVWADEGECRANPRYMMSNCRKSCDNCDGAKDAAAGGGGGTDCSDTQWACAVWADEGECQANPEYMLSYCRKSCGRC